MLRRLVWDGDQLLGEIQVPLKFVTESTAAPDSVQDNDRYQPQLVPQDDENPDLGKDPNPFFGRVLYTHGLALDQPVASTRFAYVDHFPGTPSAVAFPPQPLALFWTSTGALGLAGCGTGTAGLQCRATNASGRQATMFVGLPTTIFAYQRPRTDFDFFQGSLLRDQQEATGLLYRRARSYDPATGRFTQEDPIGLAGGLNLYGFADSDPINFSDPFGLCPACVAYAAFEVGSSLYDAYDLAKTGIAYLRGRASRAELGVTAAGAALGIVSTGGGFGRAGRVGLTTAQSWGNAGVLARHFKDHGADFGAANADEYASMASHFLQSAQKRRLPTKIDSDGVIRVYDKNTNTFGSYNPDGTTKTFFKPSSPTYWDRQPGKSP
jgi:RHS repeat-associated protein